MHGISVSYFTNILYCRRSVEETTVYGVGRGRGRGRGGGLGGGGGVGSFHNLTHVRAVTHRIQ